MLNKTHILIYILIAGVIFTLPACSNATDTQVSTIATSTRLSNFNTENMIFVSVQEFKDYYQIDTQVDMLLMATKTNEIQKYRL